MVVLEELFSSQTIEEPAGECGECTVHHGFEAGSVERVEAVHRADDKICANANISEEWLLSGK